MDPVEVGSDRSIRAVLSLFRFSAEAEAIRIANGTPYGLASYVDPRPKPNQPPLGAASSRRRVREPGITGHRLGVAVRRVGMSGYGREGGEEGLFAFLRMKEVTIA